MIPKTVIVSALHLGECLGISSVAVHQRAALGKIPPPDARIINRPGNYWTLQCLRRWRPDIADTVEKHLESQMTAA